MPYKQVNDGEWVIVKGRYAKIMCCDCGLVHILEFDKPDLKFRAERDQRATATTRRRRKREILKT